VSLHTSRRVLKSQNVSLNLTCVRTLKLNCIHNCYRLLKTLDWSVKCSWTRFLWGKRDCNFIFVLVALLTCFATMLSILLTIASLNGKYISFEKQVLANKYLPINMFLSTSRPTSLVGAFLKIYSLVRPHLSFPALFSWVFTTKLQRNTCIGYFTSIKCRHNYPNFRQDTTKSEIRSNAKVIKLNNESCFAYVSFLAATEFFFNCSLFWCSACSGCNRIDVG
jgi:hypothetical protein